GVLALLSVVGGFLQFAPLWHPLTTWLEPVARPLGEPSNTREWFASGLAIVVGLGGIFVAWAIYSAKRIKAPRAVRLFEQKFYWDELYDLVWYRSADLLARGLYAVVERPLIAGSMSAMSGAVGLGSRELSVAENGLVRTYVLALAGGLAVLGVVFLAAR
ncbi:MAG TPA: hypothetical protein VNH45_08420, partial [Gaiellaceae bacterium]|nr:hypothetical protein [Gaiellaceae bacterium]